VLTLTSPSSSLKHELVLLANVLDARLHCSRVGFAETMVFRAEDRKLLEAHVIPSRHPSSFFLVEEDAADTASALIWLGAAKLATLLQHVVEDDGALPGLLPPVAIRSGTEGPENLDAMSVPHYHPSPFVMVPDHMPAAVLVHRHSGARSSFDPLELHSLS